MDDDLKADRDAPEEEADEIEILEVVGLDEDAPSPPDQDPDEVEVSFDEGPVRRDDAGTSNGQAGAEEGRADASERLLRLQADFENLKKRIEREKDDYFRHATANLVARLLPVIDNFERALAVPDAESADGAFREGVGLIHRQLLEELRREGLKPIDAEGQPFDPSLHEAVATDSSSDLPAHTVVEELKRGYFFQDRLLRPASVRVTVNADEESGGDDGEES
jgi:molecular chaperone GrpE